MAFILVSVINGTHPTLRSDPYSPGAVLRVLHAQGWVIPPEEHDAHELFHVILTSLEEEAIRPKKVHIFLLNARYKRKMTQIHIFIATPDWLSFGCIE